jgi:nitrate/nitrite transporter NarK
MLFGGCCILLAVATIPHSLSIAFALIVLSGVGAYGPMGAFWAIPTETLPPAIVGSAMGLVNAIGNLGAYFAPLIVGYLNKRTGTFLAGFTYLGAITLVGAGLAAMLRTVPENGS